MLQLVSTGTKSFSATRLTSEDIYDAINAKSGRFVRKTIANEQSSFWEVVDDEVAVEKVKQALRDQDYQSRENDESRDRVVDEKQPPSTEQSSLQAESSDRQCTLEIATQRGLAYKPNETVPFATLPPRISAAAAAEANLGSFTDNTNREIAQCQEALAKEQLRMLAPLARNQQQLQEALMTLSGVPGTNTSRSDALRLQLNLEQQAINELRTRELLTSNLLSYHANQAPSFTHPSNPNLAFHYNQNMSSLGRASIFTSSQNSNPLISSLQSSLINGLLQTSARASLNLESTPVQGNNLIQRDIAGERLNEILRTQLTRDPAYTSLLGSWTFGLPRHHDETSDSISNRVEDQNKKSMD